MTRVSVLIPAYNHERYVQESIKSIFNQTYRNIELIVIDDGSTDNTFQKMEEIRSLCEKRFSRVVFLRQENQGIATTLSTLLSYAEGDYVYLIASDDIAKPNAIEKEVKFLDKNPQYGLVVGDDEIIDSNGFRCFWDSSRNNVYNEKEAKYKTFVEFLKVDNPYFNKNFGKYWTLYIGNYVPNGYLIRKSLLDKIGGYTKEAPLEDWYMMLQLSKYCKFKYLDEVLFQYRWHSNNTIKQTEKIIEYERLTRDYENKLLENLRKNKKLKHITESVRSGRLIKQRGVHNLFEILKYEKGGVISKVVKILGIKLFVIKRK